MKQINELYDNKEGFTVDDFKNANNVSFDKKTGEEYICGFPVIYQVTKKSNIESIFKNGFDRAFTGSVGGNMYGPGIYSTYKLASTQNNVKHGDYGDTFVKMLVLSKFKDFLIFDMDMAQKIHGKMWRPKDQLIHFFGKDAVNKMEHTGFWPELMNMRGRTAPAALSVWNSLARSIGEAPNGNSDEYLIKHGVSGFIFFGNRDGFVSVVRDFKNILPIAYSFDRGKTWNNNLFTQDTVNTIFHDVDGRTFYGKDIDKFTDTRKMSSALNKRINDFIMVRMRDGKYNFMDMNHNLLSRYIGFDSVSPVRDNGLAYVEINDPKYLEVMEEPFQGYVSRSGVHWEEDPDDFMTWDEFNSFIKENDIK